MISIEAGWVKVVRNEMPIADNRKYDEAQHGGSTRRPTYLPTAQHSTWNVSRTLGDVR